MSESFFPLKLVIITGTSGGGKSTALKTFEDLGFFCVDNLPPPLLPKFLELAQKSRVERIALVMDVREREFREEGNQVLQKLIQIGYKPEILFFDAQDDVLLRRFKETRRKHPLAQEGKTLAESIGEERKYLNSIRQMATQVVDTSFFSVHDLKRWIEARYAKAISRQMQVQIISFGFKFGIPSEADLVFDVRFLPNPHFVPELRPLNGRSEAIKNFFKNDMLLKKFMEKLLDMLKFLLPFYQYEGKHYLNIAIGCTGGRHRSVFVAEKLLEMLKNSFSKKDYRFSLIHRDIEAQ
ncbi:MAG: RNase adapter RapZ [Candidatus Desulfofervidus auxilii]|nr:RNase adapter RapZ [Candidatus Desulfofervidus auxilii]